MISILCYKRLSIDRNLWTIDRSCFLMPKSRALFVWCVSKFTAWGWKDHTFKLTKNRHIRIIFANFS